MLTPWIYYLKEDEQLIIESPTRRWAVNGPGRYVTRPFWRARRVRGLSLSPTEYVRVQNTLTGEVRNVIGPTLLFPEAHEEVVKRLSALPLKRNQYVKLMDSRTGEIRVERGEQSVYLGPTEELLGGVEQGINIDEHTAVLVRDTAGGQLALITAPQVFIPAPTQEIIEERRRILLENHEVVVVKDREGRYLFKRGSDSDRSFFLPPYAKLVQFRWSAGIRKDQRSLVITHIDIRPKFMWYAFEARTKDNVELVIDITFFWQLVDVEAMVVTTDDVPGDVCAHARSAIIQAVSQVTMEQFLGMFNQIVHAAVIEADATFYVERGVKLHSVEVRSITCKDANTQRILQEIIQETTNRLNRLQKQESENEIKVKQVQGEIETERQRELLLSIRRSLAQAQAQSDGEAEAERVRAFLAGLGDQLPLADKLLLFNLLRKQDTIDKLSRSKATIYFTPADIDLSIETRPALPGN
ncbi:MAG TPA: SPFH domain-containing protein [Herpetosiphonaceae bacterium]